MPTLRWTTVHTPAPDAEAFVMASRLEVRSPPTSRASS